jgi:hypothetical protein
VTSSNDIQTGKGAKMLPRAVSALLAMILSHASANAGQVPPGRTVVPNVHYTQIAPNKVISAFTESFRHAGFSVAEREVIKAAYGPDTLKLVFSFDAAKPPYKANVEYSFTPSSGSDKNTLLTIYFKGNYLTVGDASKEKENARMAGDIDRARAQALANAETSMGEHQRPPEYLQSW